MVSDLVPTPRAAKRLVNIYRMLRVSVPDSELPAFLPRDAATATDDGEYQAVILLLGILIGRPSVAQQLFNSLAGSSDESTVWQLLDKFPELHQPLQRVRGHMTVSRIDAYRRWAPRVARFSFRTSTIPTSA